MTNASYKFAPEKALQAVHWMALEGGERLDLHAALKACYFADKSHINQYQQPIFGARYRAMKFGPVPLEIYEIIKGESLWLWELNVTALPWELDGYSIRRISNQDPDLAVFGESELHHLREGLERSLKMTFTARTAATHGSDWHAANGGIMRYEDMIEDGPDRDRVISFIQDTASHIRL